MRGYPVSINNFGKIQVRVFFVSFVAILLTSGILAVPPSAHAQDRNSAYLAAGKEAYSQLGPGFFINLANDGLYKYYGVHQMVGTLCWVATTCTCNHEDCVVGEAYFIWDPDPTDGECYIDDGLCEWDWTFLNGPPEHRPEPTVLDEACTNTACC